MNLVRNLIAPAVAVTISMAATAADDATWINQIGGPGADVVYALTETSDDRLCATGTAWTGGRFGRNGEEVVLESDNEQQMFVACYYRSGDLAFVTPMPAQRGDRPYAIAALADGDLLVTGSRQGVDGQADLFLNRLDNQGAIVWSRSYGSALADSGNALAVSADGQIYLAGGFEGTLHWRDGTRLAKLNSVGSRDAVVLQLNGRGDIVWARALGGQWFDEATALTARAGGGVVVGGSFRETITIDGEKLVARGYRDAFVVAYDDEGAFVWSQHVGGPAQDAITGLVQTSSGDTIAAGFFGHSLILSGQPTLVSAGNTDGFVTRLNPHGQVEHAVAFGGSLTDQVFALAIDAKDNLFLAGHYQGTSDLDPGPGVANLDAPSPGNSSGFLLILAGDSQYITARAVAGAGMEMALGVHALRDGHVGLTGLFNKDVGLPIGERLDARGKTDIFVARLAVFARARPMSNSGLFGGSILDDHLSW